MRMEQAGRGVLEMAAAGVNFPSFGFCEVILAFAQYSDSPYNDQRTTHAPKLDKSIIASGDYKRKVRMEGDPIDSSVMPLKDKFDDSIRVSEHF